jgi:hypothetical protein
VHDWNQVLECWFCPGIIRVIRVIRGFNSIIPAKEKRPPDRYDSNQGADDGYSNLTTMRTRESYRLSTNPSHPALGSFQPSMIA